MSSTYRHRVARHRCAPVPAGRESGYILLMVAVFILILLGGSTQFFTRATESTRISGGVRDNTEARLLAESALNHLMGRFVNTLDANGNGTPDKTDAGFIQLNMADPRPFLMPYMFYASAGTAIDQTGPSLLQKVANGEARNVANVPLVDPRVGQGTARLRVDDLFIGAGVRPMLYTLDANGMLVGSAAASWSAETNPRKAAAWIETTRNPDQADAVDIYVQAVARAGNAHCYLQRYVGTYFASVTIGSISVLAEASNIAR